MENNEKSNVIDFSDRTKPSLEQWDRLYKAAANLKKMTPWDTFTDMDLITLEMPDEAEPLFCSVMGSGKQCYGVAVYPGYEAFSLLMALLDTTDGETLNPYTFEQQALLCYFGDREDITPVDRDIMKQLGIRFRGRNQWVYFRSVEPGLLPWYITANQAELLASALEGVSAACVDYRDMSDTVEFENGETLICSLGSKTGEWSSRIASMPKTITRYESWSLSDELMLARLKQKEKVSMTVEMDTFYIPTPIQEKKDDIPMLPRLSVVMDRKSGMLLEHDIQTGPSSPAAILNCLVNFIMKHGRPTKICVRNKRIAHIVQNTCDCIGIRLSEGEGMPLADEFFANMEYFM